MINNHNIENTNNRIKIDQLLPLETIEESMVGYVNKLVLSNGKIILLDFQKTNSVLSFENNGKFSKRIYNIGKSENEYLFNRDFIVNENSSGYYLFDKKLDKLLEFDTSFNFIKKIDIPFSINTIINLSSDSFLVERSSENNFFVNLCDSEFNIVDEYIKRPNHQLHYDINNPFPFKMISKSKLLYHPSFSSYIYQYENDRFKRKYKIIDKKGFPDENFFNSNKGVHPGRLLDRIKNEMLLSFLDFYENDDYLVLKYYRGSEPNVTIYNKRKNESTTFNTSIDCINASILNNIKSTDENGRFVSFIYPFELAGNIELDQTLENFMLRNVTGEENNPIIVYFYLVN